MKAPVPIVLPETNITGTRDQFAQVQERLKELKEKGTGLKPVFLEKKPVNVERCARQIL